MGVLRVRANGTWVDVGMVPQRIVGYTMSYVSGESADISANTTILTLAVPFVAGRYYDVKGYISVINRSASGSTGALPYLNVGALQVQSAEVNVWAPNIMMKADFSVIWQATATGAQNVVLGLGKTWWASANNPRWIRGGGTPLGIAVIDMGA